ncbi:hypothetical protein ACIPJS_31120 [Streptomyces sp. NPDC086783]|uniref:hypothetical protein n=1 Tax=Streptomyces sp. NPDC086783 TaxID=3365758 RepID=UPI003819045D
MRATVGRVRARTRAWPVFLTAVLVVLCGAGGAGAAQDDRHLPGRNAPDRALVVAGDTGRTVALRSGERDFARLWQLLEPAYTGTERVPAEWMEGDFPRVRATVVWGISGVGGWPQTDRSPGGDVAVRRADQLFLAEDGTPWVRSDPAPDVPDDDIRWHRASRSVYERLDGELFGPLGDAPDTAAPAPRDRARWALWGLAAGLALGCGGTVLLRAAAARRGAGPPREPRQELIDR